MNKNLLEIKEMKLEIIIILLITTSPIILFDGKSEFYQAQTFNAMLINSVSFISIYFFINLLKIPNKFSKKILILLAIWTCILPLFFYYTYSKDPTSFAFNKEYLTYQKHLNNNDFNYNEEKFTEIKPNIISEKNTLIFRKTLPRNSDTLIILKNYIILSPYTIPPHGGTPPPKTYIKLYDRSSGKFLLQFEKKSNLLDSYEYFEKNLNFKINKAEKPEIGITYFDFWSSSIIGFRDNLITPLRIWIVSLTFVIISIIFVPIFDYLKNKHLNQTKTNNGG